MSSLADLGKRICVIGPSNSGKSTLAERLAAKIGVPVIHLDQLAHIPGTNWKRRPDVEFVAAHDQAIAAEGWVMDGNYSVAMPQRFRRATAVIWLDPPLSGFLFRYLKRSFVRSETRPGNLKGAKKDFNWSVVKYTFFNYPKNRNKYAKFITEIDPPVLNIKSMKELNAYYKHWGLLVT